jgi:hypothetical protein
MEIARQPWCPDAEPDQSVTRGWQRGGAGGYHWLVMARRLLKRKKHLAIAAVALAGLAGAGVAYRRRRRPASAPAVTYRAAEGAKAFHQPGCRFYDPEKLDREFATIREAVIAGHRPCKLCVV